MEPMMRATYISNGSLERARRRRRLRWWAMAGVNTLCMLLFTASMLMLFYIFIDRLG